MAGVLRAFAFAEPITIFGSTSFTEPGGAVNTHASESGFTAVWKSAFARSGRMRWMIRVQNWVVEQRVSRQRDQKRLMGLAQQRQLLVEIPVVQDQPIPSLRRFVAAPSSSLPIATPSSSIGSTRVFFVGSRRLDWIHCGSVRFSLTRSSGLSVNGIIQVSDHEQTC
jgi:hypothetical protein